MNMINTEIYKAMDTNETVISTKIQEPMLRETLNDRLLCDISRAIADKYVSEFYQEIIAKIDQKAIATLSVAEASSKIRETLEKKIPDKVLEIVKEKPVYVSKSLFGGVKIHG